MQNSASNLTLVTCFIHWAYDFFSPKISCEKTLHQKRIKLGEKLCFLVRFKNERIGKKKKKNKNLLNLLQIIYKQI